MGALLESTSCFAASGWPRWASQSALPVYSREERLAAFRERYGKELDFQVGDLLDYDYLKRFLAEFQPDGIVQLGQMPSAPIQYRDHFITTSSSAAPFGNVRVLTTNTTPTVADGNGRYNNLNQISMWGVIFHEANGAGFAMEFIGDMHDSTVLSTGNGSNVVDLTTGRGIN